MPPDKNSPILIVGGGTFGLSTAYHLFLAGYKSITVLEKGSAIPSPLSAANDVNKIIRAEYEDPFYTELALEAMREWTSNGLFSPYYHQRGYLLCNSKAAPEKTRRTLAKSLESIARHPAWRGRIHPVRTRDDIRQAAPALDGPMDGWEGYFNELAGYAHSAKALAGMAEYLRGHTGGAVRIELGEEVTGLAYGGGGGDANQCIGAVTASGRHVAAETVIVTLGASTGTVLPAVGRQITATAWSVLHVRLDSGEAERLAGIPVTYARDLGFFFEPEPGTAILKICPSSGGYTNFHDGPATEGRSVPAAASGFVPDVDVERARRLLRETLPWLAERPLVDKHLCWCADTADTEYVIDALPGKKGVYVATGDSGHAFKMFPVAGQWVRKLVEQGHQDLARWRWKEVADVETDVSWRPGQVTDLSAVPAKARL